MFYESTLYLQGLSSSTQIFARPRTSSWHCILNLWQWLSQIFRKKCLRHFLPDCSYELSKGNRSKYFFACLKITTHKLQRALVATSFNNWAAISFTQLWHIGVKSFLNLVSYTCILSKDIYETLLHNSVFYWSSAKNICGIWWRWKSETNRNAVVLKEK